MIPMSEAEAARWPAYAMYCQHAGEDDAEAIGAFIEWLQRSPYQLAVWAGEKPFETLALAHVDPETLLCAYYGIDYRQAMREKAELLDEALAGIRALNARKE